MAKLTKKSYRRKRMLMGLSLFMSIALISTGFAAWVISSSQTKSLDGNVSVGNVSDKSIELEVSFAKDSEDNDLNNIKFEPLETDVTGRVRNDGKNFESLSVTINGKIKDEGLYLKSLSVELVELVEENGETVPYDYTSGSSNLQVAEEEGYIVLPESLNQKIYLYDFDDKDENLNPGTETTWNFTQASKESTVHEFSYKIEFKWGDKFGGMNPGIYYDQPDNTDEDKTVINELVNLRTMIYGVKTNANPNGTKIPSLDSGVKMYDDEGNFTNEFITSEWYENLEMPKYRIIVRANT